MIDLADPRDVERATFDAIAAADAVFADEVHDAIGVLHDRAGRRARLQTARILAMHATVLPDQPFQIALVVLPLGEAHQRPYIRAQIERIVVGSLEVPDLLPQVVPLHAGRLAALAADAAADVHQL